jgi:hypothetical protein
MLQLCSRVDWIDCLSLAPPADVYFFSEVIPVNFVIIYPGVDCTNYLSLTPPADVYSFLEVIPVIFVFIDGELL